MTKEVFLEVPSIDEVDFRAVKDGREPRSRFYMSLLMIGIGLGLAVTPLFIRGVEELTLGWAALIVGLGLFIVLCSYSEAKDYHRLARPGSVYMDGRSVRYYEDGFLMYEIPFDDDLKVGISINYSFSIGSYRPLYGIEFYNDDHCIEIGYLTGYSNFTAGRLWPSALAIIREYDPELTTLFKRHLEYERKRGGYWASIADILLPEDECLFQEVSLERKEGGSKRTMTS